LLAPKILKIVVQFVGTKTTLLGMRIRELDGCVINDKNAADVLPHTYSQGLKEKARKIANARANQAHEVERVLTSNGPGKMYF
jgi:hypothetical protein